MLGFDLPRCENYFGTFSLFSLSLSLFAEKYVRLNVADNNFIYKETCLSIADIRFIYEAT